ncbi:hypothetical protein CAPTEDRAFT_210333 [Capitella teleta]|uniref:Uncharacterized protein n=1 Tax=Capitella teleta TaxID=283909 RepID=N1PBD4_CAPTE|nr:hypothetical protein CAPTEDRAFT_210333 [Capitella teleta]|eukprot:ELU18859.1 hypothetical protein CAPTEDRAFT_210333 [Capitella teleta]
MGCGSSTNKVSVVGSNVNLPRSPSKKVDRPRSKTVRVVSKGESDVVSEPKHGPRLLKRRGKQQGWGSQTSLGSNTSGDGRRGVSASSKASHHSMDSGFADTTEYKHVVTEFSEADKIRQVEDCFQTPRDLDLTLSGTACPQRTSAKNKERLNEQRVMAALREEGLIARPVSMAPKGLAFEIITESAGMFAVNRKPPPRLEKLEKRRKKKKPLTQEQIQAKLLRAEERKKEREQQRLAKIQSLAKSDVQNALESFAVRQQEQEESHKTKEEQAAENRERRMKDVRDKLKAKQEHAEAVRRRKKMAPIQIPESPRNGPTSARSSDGRPDGLEPVGYGLDATAKM